MKIGILTLQRAENYGAVLQAYALQTYLKSICDGLNVEIIDYRNKAIEWSCSAKHLIQKKNVKNYIKYFLRAGDIRKRNCVFSQFRERKFNLSRSCNHEDFSELAKIYDLIIVGSDQVWNDELTGNDPTFFLDSVEDSVKKVSYAISLGMDKYNENFFLKHKQQIEDFASLSMREQSGAEFIKAAYGRKVELCIDPVFLLEQSEWRRFAGSSTSQQEYILCFVLRSDNREDRTVNIARELSKKTGYPIRLLMNQNRFYKFPDLRHIENPSPEEFINLIDNAEIVVTNSFHASALSILFHTTFYSDLEVKRNRRIVDLLNTVGLESNGCKNGVAPKEIRDIDWSQVDRRISESSISSRKYLGDLISERKSNIDGIKKR